MKSTPKEVILSLKTGDLLVIPFQHPTFDNLPMVFSSVLRIDVDGGIYLSMIADGMTAIPYSARNPFRWDDAVGALVDRDGEVLEWYSDDIRVEPGGARKIVEEYALVPRMEQLRFSVPVEELKAFADSDPRFQKLAGITRNGEVPILKDQLLLLLDAVGVECTREQYIGIYWAFELTTREVFQHLDQILPRFEAFNAGAQGDSFILPAPAQATRQ